MGKNCRIDVNVNNTRPASLRAAFEFAVGTVRTLQIAFTAARDDDASSIPDVTG